MALAMGTTSITATQGSIISPGDTLTIVAATLSSIAVTPASPSVANGLTEQFTATGTFSDGTQSNITNSVTWASSVPTVASINATGLATGLAVGTTGITATQGSVVSPGDTLTVTAASLSSIAVTPAGPTITTGLTQQFTATGVFSDGSTSNITNSVTWASSAPAVGTINATGLVSSLAVGTTSITATQGSIISPGDTLTVTNPLVSIAVTPSSPVAKGLTQQFTATGTFSDGTQSNITNTVTWASRRALPVAFRVDQYDGPGDGPGDGHDVNHGDARQRGQRR